MARDVQDKGGYLSHADLRDYRAEIQTPLSLPYRDARFHVPDGLTAGPTFAHVMGTLADRDLSAKPEAFAAYAEALKSALCRTAGHDGR